MTPHNNTPNHQKILKEIGKRICVLRKINGLSREDLAIKTNICPKLLLKYEAGRGEMTVDKLIKIAEVLGLGVGRLFPE